MTKDEPRPILVPVDFSEDARAALIWAGELAQLIDAPVVVLHVVHDPSHAPGYYRDTEDLLQPMEAVAAKMLQRFLKHVGKDVGERKFYKNLSTKLVLGLPVSRILEVADKLNARMIVMGSQGRTGLKRLLLGSKAEQVVRIAQVPVIIVKAERGKAAKDERPVKAAKAEKPPKKAAKGAKPAKAAKGEKAEEAREAREAEQ